MQAHSQNAQQMILITKVGIWSAGGPQFIVKGSLKMHISLEGLEHIDLNSKMIYEQCCISTPLKWKYSTNYSQNFILDL